MRQILSTGLVALIVGALAGATVGAVAQSPAETEQAISPSAVSRINADKVDGRHAVGSGASKAKRARKLVATNSSGFLPSNIVKPYWAKIKNKPAGFADGVDNAGVTKITITQVKGTGHEIAGHDTGWASASCPSGSKVEGGGFHSSSWDMNVVVSHGVGFTWDVGAKNNGDASATLTAYVYCMSTVPSGAISAVSKGTKPATRK